MEQSGGGQTPRGPPRPALRPPGSPHGPGPSDPADLGQAKCPVLRAGRIQYLHLPILYEGKEVHH